MWTPYEDKKLAVAQVVCSSEIDIWTLVAPLILFQMVEVHYLDRIM
jgi:hypothetical protein